MATVTRGWSRARLGEIAAGVRDVDRGLEIAAATGSSAGVTLLCVAAAEVHCIAGNRERAEALLDRATETMERRGERNGYAHRILAARANVELELGNASISDVEAMLLEALGGSRRNDMFCDELAIATQLARIAPKTGRACEAHERLAELYGRLTEGFDRPATVAARVAIDALAVSLEDPPTPNLRGHR
jgi:predicted ATPase